MSEYIEGFFQLIIDDSFKFQTLVTIHILKMPTESSFAVNFPEVTEILIACAGPGSESDSASALLHEKIDPIKAAELICLLYQRRDDPRESDMTLFQEVSKELLQKALESLPKDKFDPRTKGVIFGSRSTVKTFFDDHARVKDPEFLNQISERTGNNVA